jgi:aquaporin Z
LAYFSTKPTVMNKYITELIGTFFLVLVIGMSGGMGSLAPIAIGSTLMVMIFAGGHISGAHYNPAVTLAVLIRGKVSVSDAIAYIIVQVAGAALAAMLVLYITGADNFPVSMDNVQKGLIAEVVATFALAYVVLNVATAKGTAGNSFYGLAIGFTVMAMAYAFGAISKGAFNPAVAVGLCVLKIAPWSDLWIYMVACFAGAAVAALVFRLNNPEDK